MAMAMDRSELVRRTVLEALDSAEGVPVRESLLSQQVTLALCGLQPTLDEIRRAVEAMEAKGWIVRQHDDFDVVRLGLTAKGQMVLARG